METIYLSGLGVNILSLWDRLEVIKVGVWDCFVGSNMILLKAAAE